MKKIGTLAVSLAAVSMSVSAMGPRKVSAAGAAADVEVAQVSADAHNFVVLGEGLMTDAMVTEWYQYAPVTYKVTIHKAEDADIYRVIAPYGQAFADAMLSVNGVQLADSQYDKAGVKVLELDATDPDEVYFAKTMIGCDWGEGEMYIGIPTTGNVTFREGIFSSAPRGVAVGDDGGAVALNMSNKFRIVLPGVTPTDYELTLTPDSHCLTDGTVSGTLTVGNDIAQVYYGILSDFQEDEILQAYGQVMVQKQVFDQRGHYRYGANDDFRKETLALVGVNAAGEEVAYAWTTYYNVSGNDDEWESIGSGEFTDPFLPALLDCDSETLTVEVEKHKTITGYVRMRNPYSTSKYATPSYFHGGEPDHDHFIYINGTDPGCIYIEESPICFDFGYGLCRVSSFVQYFLQAGYDLEECKELELGGVLEDGVLTFPGEALNFSMLGFDNGDWYYTDPDKGDFALKMPGGYDFSGVDNITVDHNYGAAEYYDLRGVRVDVENAAPGLYIVRRGDESRKIVLP